MTRTSSRKIALGLALMLLGCMAIPLVAPGVSAEPREFVNELAPLPEPRLYAGVVEDNGKLYVMGGSNSIVTPVPLASVIIYDVATETTKKGADMQFGMVAPASAKGADGKLYVIGGINFTLGGLTQITQIYDPLLDQWTTGAPATFPVALSPAVALNNGKIVVFNPNDSNRTIIYDTALDSWSNGTNSSVTGTVRNAVLWNDTAVIVMGGVEGPTVLATVEIYNPVADTWTSAASMPTSAVFGGSAVARDGFVYYIGGNNATDPFTSILVSMQRYDPTTDTWEISKTTLPAPRTGEVAVSDAYGRIFLVGGYDGVEVLDAVTMITTADFESDKLSIVSPTNGAVVSDVVMVSVVLSDQVVGFSTVELYVDGSLLASGFVGMTSSVAFSWNTTGLGDGTTHVLLARGFMVNGQVKESTVTVKVSALSVEDQVAAIEAQVTALADEIAALQANLGAADANVTQLRADLAVLQAQVMGLQMGLAQIGAGLATMGAGQVAAGALLNATLVALQGQLNGFQTQLDDFQVQIDRVEGKADNAGMIGIVTVVLIIIVIVILVMMFMAMRKKA